MAGIDEASARSVLAAMQDRLARDPLSALGITASATADDVRSAFLELTKLYHPVRFGRMAVDIQKLSNEVFLALRAAHDGVVKALRRQTGPIATPRTPASPGAPTLPPAPGNGRVLPPVPARAVRPPGASDAGERAPAVTPSAGSRIVARPAAPQPAARPGAPAGSTRAGTTSPPATAPAGPRDESVVLDLLSRQQWDQARTALHQLSARDPGSKRLRALACYARGREAQLEGRVDDARVELHDAVDLDPELQLAKTALTELFTRRK